MGIKEMAVAELFSTGVERLEKNLNVKAIQKKYNAYAERVVQFTIDDVVMAPIVFKIKDGRLIRLSAPARIDNKVRFRYLNDVLDVLYGKLALKHLYAWDGFRRVSGRWEKVAFFEGDVAFGVTVLQEVMENYVRVLRQVLDEMTSLKYFIRPIAVVKKALSPSKMGDIAASQVKA